jgi:acyl carrier protein
VNWLPDKGYLMATTDTSPQTVEATIFDAIAQLGPDRADVKRDATFEQLDIDSLDLVEVAQVVEEQFGLEFDPQDFGNVKTVGEAVDVVLARLP